VHGEPSAVLLATEDLESLEETIEVLADAMRRLHASDTELAHGDTETLEDLDAAMQRRRHTVTMNGGTARRGNRRRGSPLGGLPPAGLLPPT